MNHKEYNGWWNYETWLVNLWMDNEEGSYRYWGEVAGETYEEAEAEKPFSKEERAKLDLSERLKEEHEEAAPELQGVFSDLLNAAMSEVNWYEIAEHMIDEYVQDKPQVKEG
jgi:hypothetical protein